MASADPTAIMARRRSSTSRSPSTTKDPEDGEETPVPLMLRVRVAGGILGAMKNKSFVLAALLALPAAAAAAGSVRIIQTNSAGDNVHLIDPATNKVVGEIKGIR